MKYSVREAVARAYVGWDLAQADRAIAWLDECGYAIVSKAALLAIGIPIAAVHDKATPIPASTAPKELG